MNRTLLALTRSLLLALVATGLLSPSESRAAASTYSRNYVQKAYVAYYGRPADPAGQEYWASRMDAAGGSLSAIIAAFGNSAEFNSRYGGMSNSALVTKIYQQALSRNPDPAGLNYYVSELQAGRKTLQTITLDVLNGASTEPDSIVVDNKLLVAAYYTSRVAGGCAYGTEQDGVNNISTVTADTPTVVASADAINTRCGPPGATASNQGTWSGKTSSNSEITGIIFDSGDYYFVYSAPGTGDPGGFMQGTLGTSNGRNFKIYPGPGSANSISFSTTYVPHVYLKGSIVEQGVTTTFTGLYESDDEQPANAALAAGTYMAQVGTPTSGWQVGTMTFSPNGTLSGTAAGCTFSGTIVPHGAVNIFDLTVRFDSANCIFGTGTSTGILHYDPSDRMIIGAAPNALRTSGFMILGQK